MDDLNPQEMFEAMVDQALENNDDIQSMSFEEEESTTAVASSSTNNPSSSHNNNTLSGINSNQSSKGDIFYCENYFDVNDILAQSNRIPITFQRTIPKIGFLDPGNDEDKILKGTKLELPLWIVKELYADQVVSITVPKGYNQTYREILEADANCVNLHKLGPNFYRLGQHLSSMNLPESEDIANSIIGTFTQRFHRLVNFALSGNNVGGIKDSKIDPVSNLSKMGNKSKSNSGSVSTSAGDDVSTLSDMLAYTNSLDNWEKGLLRVGQSTARQLKRWGNQELTMVKPNEMITNLNKRKRLVEEHLKYAQQNENHFSQGAKGRPASPIPSSSEPLPPS